MTDSLERMSVSQLVERFTQDGLKQFTAELYDEHTTYNRLSREMIAISEELKTRAGDQRAALMVLFAHPNPQVRLMAAEVTLAVAPIAARQTLQTLWDQREFPQAAQATQTLRALERGDRKPT